MNTKSKTVTAAIALVAAALLGGTVAATPALASADKCAGNYASQSCVAVNGTNLHVNWIKSRIDVYARHCVYGHSQVLINGQHMADSPGWDQNWCVSGWPGKELTTGTWYVSRNYAKGTKICAKFWVATGSEPDVRYSVLGNACATVG
jgi:hypothetical protein